MDSADIHQEAAVRGFPFYEGWVEDALRPKVCQSCGETRAIWGNGLCRDCGGS